MTSTVRRFRNILFSPLAARGSSAAIRKVVALARRDDAEVTVVGVIPAPSRLQRVLHGSGHVDQVLSALHSEMARSLARCERAVAGQYDVATIVDVGGRALSLIQRAIAAEHDLLVVSSDGSDEEMAVIRRLLRKSPCPVWVLRPSRSKHARVLAAIDPEPDERDFNEMILDTAASLCAIDDGELHVANAWELFGGATMQTSAFLNIDALELDKQRNDVRQAHECALTELVRTRLGDEPTIHVVPGSPVDVIGDLIERERINLVVMGTVGRSGVSGLVMGNTAERLADAITCSLVAVKPPGFVSPILA